MCGIAGYIGGFWPGLAGQMNAVQAHRGPDGQGIFESEGDGLALAHVRLSILDTSDAAAQPMISDDGRYVLSYNGEIYNFPDIKKDLEAKGHSFTSSGDTEVILKGFIEYGADILPRLDGIFALALWETQKKTLLLARDHLGIKPLYYYQTEDGVLVFASEIKAICAHPDVKRTANLKAIHEHLGFSYAIGNHTALEGVMRLPAGHVMTIRTGSTDAVSTPFWSMYETHEAFDLKTSLAQSVRRQMVSDVPLGSFLSGGLDSSLITSLAARHTSDKALECFTITYPPEDNTLDQMVEDAPYAEVVSKALDVPLNASEVNPDVTDMLPKLIWHMDEPVSDPAIITCYMLAHEAHKKGMKVMLSGQGADEVFCGYHRYRVMCATSWCHKLPQALRNAMATIIEKLPSAKSGKIGALSRRVKKALSDLDQNTEQRFLKLAATAPDTDDLNVFADGFKVAVNDSFTEQAAHNIEGVSTGLRKLQAHDLSSYMPNHNLLYSDKMGMATGVEVRVPLLGIEVVKSAMSAPISSLVNMMQSKRSLRAAAKDIVPDTVISRPKAGFGAPYRMWLRRDLEGLWSEIMSEEAVKARGWFNYDAIKDIRERSQSGSQDLYMLQWSLITLEIWAKQFLDRNPADGYDQAKVT